jgi:squalene-associated FAD-dependent desaturase
LIAVIGAGLTGLTAAIRMAEQGKQVELFEASPQPGGRTRSFHEVKTNQACDNGPHLLIGAYSATQKLLEDCGASANVHWQPSLQLPLWDSKRGLFSFKPSSHLPFSLALLLAAVRLPGHGMASALAMLRLGKDLQSTNLTDTATVQNWIEKLNIPDVLANDLINPLCLGAMNVQPEGANALSFQSVLKESFASHQHARLGWFTQPMSEALIKPLVYTAQKLGVNIHCGCPVRSLLENQSGISINGQQFEAAIFAMPAYATDRLLKRESSCETRAISNIHLWFNEDIQLPAPLIGGIGTTGQWFFDVSQQISEDGPLKHFCAVISADEAHTQDADLVHRICAEVQAICGREDSLAPLHTRIIREKRATMLVRPQEYSNPLPPHTIDASERPLPGELPATIESAVRRGENAAELCRKSLL